MLISSINIAGQKFMKNFIEVARTSEFKDGIMQKLLVQGHEILLARVKKNFYAVSNRCPHLGGKLSAGKLEETIITCPLQGSQFDLRNGKPLRWLKEPVTIPPGGKTLNPPKTLDIYNVKVEGDVVLIEI